VSVCLSLSFGNYIDFFFLSSSIKQGDLQDVHLIPGPYGYLKQCENMDAQCPTCGQFLQLQNALVELNKSFRQLTQRVSVRL
jgi:hypothetical protein